MPVPLGSLRSDAALNFIHEAPASPLVRQSIAASSEVLVGEIRVVLPALVLPVVEVPLLAGAEVFDVRLALDSGGYTYELSSECVQLGTRAKGMYWRGLPFPVVAGDTIQLFLTSHKRPTLARVVFRLFEIS